MREIDRSLRIATAEGDLTKIKQLVRKGADINAGASTGSPPLLIAIGQSSLDVVECLIDRGANVNTPDANSGTTPLHLATMLHRVDVAQLLVEHGAIVDAKRRKDGSTPLIMAAESANIEMVDFLLRSGASISTMRSTDGFSALHAACSGGNHVAAGKEAAALQDNQDAVSKEEVYMHIVSLILDKAFALSGASGVDAAIAAQAYCGLTPLHIACKHRCGNIVQMLIRSRTPRTLHTDDNEIGMKHCNPPFVWTVCKRIVKSVLLESKSQPNVKPPSSPDGSVPLLMADAYEHGKILI